VYKTTIIILYASRHPWNVFSPHYENNQTHVGGIPSIFIVLTVQCVCPLLNHYEVRSFHNKDC